MGIVNSYGSSYGSRHCLESRSESQGRAGVPIIVYLLPIRPAHLAEQLAQQLLGPLLALLRVWGPDRGERT